jgi:nicotinamide-nucleotide amidase
MMKSPVVSAAKALKERGLKLAIAESCTGGLLGHMVTNAAGSSEWFTGGVVAYSNEVKTRLLSVAPGTLKRYGAVSRQTAGAMAEGVRKRLKSDVGLAVTGIAGPEGGTAKKPVGTVFIAIAGTKNTYSKKLLLSGTRKSIKKQAAREALEELKGFLD